MAALLWLTTSRQHLACLGMIFQLFNLTAFRPGVTLSVSVSWRRKVNAVRTSGQDTERYVRSKCR